MTPNIHISSKTLFFLLASLRSSLPLPSEICFIFPSRAKEAKKKNPDARQTGHFSEIPTEN